MRTTRIALLVCVMACATDRELPEELPAAVAFTTGSALPAPGAATVPLDAEIRAQFSGPLDPASLSSSAWTALAVAIALAPLASWTPKPAAGMPL